MREKLAAPFVDTATGKPVRRQHRSIGVVEHHLEGRDVLRQRQIPVTELESDSETPAEVRERIAGQLEFLETMKRWYDSIKGMPRKTLLKMMRLGQKIAKVIGE